MSKFYIENNARDPRYRQSGSDINVTTKPNLAGMSQFPDIDLIAELRERGYKVNKNIPDKAIQDILIGYRANSDLIYSSDRGIHRLKLGEAIEKIKELLDGKIN